MKIHSKQRRRARDGHGITAPSVSTTTSGHATDATLLRVLNHHSVNCGTPPAIDDNHPDQYLGYFENEHGEQAIFIYDRALHTAVLYMGDAGWETAHQVIGGTVPDLPLADSELVWLRTCWQAATWREPA